MGAFFGVLSSITVVPPREDDIARSCLIAASKRTESLLHRIMAECEGFGARYQYSPRMMFAGAVFTAIRLSRSSSRR
jgi:hypothetical protein